MLVNDYIKLKSSPDVRKLVKQVNDISKILDDKDEDLTPVLDMFFLIFKKLHPRKKVFANISVDSDYEDLDRVVIHQFGFHTLPAGFERTRPMDRNMLFKFITTHDSDTIDIVIEEIPYKEVRKAFRKYIELVKNFIQQNNILSVKGARENVTVTSSCGKHIVMSGNNEKLLVDSITIHQYYDEIKMTLMKKNGNEIVEISLNDIDKLENMIIYEQVAENIQSVFKMFVKNAKEQSKSRIEPFMKMMKKEFAPFLVAEVI